MRRIQDEDGNPWHNDARRLREINSAVGAEGAHACSVFQCPTCWMRNLEGRDPGPLDAAYVRSIRRATLDALYGMSRGTIAQHRGRVLTAVRNAERIRKTPSLPPRGPLPQSDPLGMGLAVDIIQKSIHARGVNEVTVQTETLRASRSTYTVAWQSSPAGIAEGYAFSRGTGRVRPSACPSQSEWYQAFWRGLEARMGYKARANHALSIAAMVHTIGLIREDALASPLRPESEYLFKVGAFLTFCTAAALRGYEGFYLDLAPLIRHMERGRFGQVPSNLTKTTVLTEEECKNLPHVVLPLLGKFKGEHTVDHHMINVAHESVSGLEMRWWTDKLVEVCKAEGRTCGPAFAEPDGELASHADYNATFLEYLRRTQASTSLIERELEVGDMFGISRTPRKTQTSRAKRAGYEDMLEEMNRWRVGEAARNKQPRYKMSVLYSEACLMMPVTWRVSYAL